MNNFKKARTVQYRNSGEIDRSRLSEKGNMSIMDRTIYRFKIILLGDIAVGKTSILTRYVEDSYSNEYKCNVGVEFRVKSLFIDEKTGADLQIWDTSGEEKYRVITRQYYRDKNGVILIFDITNSKSFEALTRWLEDIKQFGPEDINIIIVGNKLDLNFQREVSFQDANLLAEKYNIKYIEVSALTGKNVPNIFEILTAAMIKQEQIKDGSRSKIKGKIDKSHVTANHNITLDRSIDPNFRNNSGSKCC